MPALLQVVLLRSGVLVHLRKYMQTLGLLPLDAPQKQEAAESGEEALAEGDSAADDAGKP